MALLKLFRTPVPLFSLTTRCYANKTLEFMNMKRQKPNKKPTIAVILEEDIPNKGFKGDLIRVKRGFARNHLIPKGLAVYAVTRVPEYLFSVRMTMNKKKKKQSKPADPKEIAQFLKDKTVTLKTKHRILYESHIASALRFELKLHVPLDCIYIPEPITLPGVTDVIINVKELNEKVTVPFDVVFEGQGSESDNILDGEEDEKIAVAA